MVEAEVLSLTASDGYAIRYRRWLPPEEVLRRSGGPAGPAPRAIVIYLHGIQSHGGWYEASSRRLAEAGLAVYFADRRGSGLNAADRGHADSWEQLARDVVDLQERALADWRPRDVSAAGLADRGPAGAAPPLFLVAVSWGGKLAAALAAMHDGRYAGLALLCPGIAARRDLSAADKLRVALALARHDDRRRMPIPLADPNLFTATPRWLEFLRADPLALHEATARFLYESRRLDRFVAGAAEWIHVPVWLALAQIDPIVDNAATRRYFERLAATDKTLRLYAGAHHTLEFEPDATPVFDELARWLTDHSRAPTGAGEPQ